MLVGDGFPGDNGHMRNRYAVAGGTFRGPDGQIRGLGEDVVTSPRWILSPEGVDILV